jgi:hypothetical protein
MEGWKEREELASPVILDLFVRSEFIFAFDDFLTLMSDCVNVI